MKKPLIFTLTLFCLPFISHASGAMPVNPIELLGQLLIPIISIILFVYTYRAIAKSQKNKPNAKERTLMIYLALSSILLVFIRVFTNEDGLGGFAGILYFILLLLAGTSILRLLLHKGIKAFKNKN